MKKILLSIFLIFSYFGTVFSFDLKSLEPIDSYVIDKAKVLNAQEQIDLDTKIKDIIQKYTSEVLIVIIPSTDGEDISSVGTEIGQGLGVGKKDKDNGIVVLIAINDRDWNISTGYGVEGVLPDLLTNQLGEKNFSSFKDKKYYEGLSGLLDDFDRVLSGDESIISEIKNNNSSENSGEFIIIILFGVSYLVSRILFYPTFKSGKYKKLLIYFIIAYILTLPIIIFLIGLFGIIINIFVWIFGGLFGMFGDKMGNGKGGKGGGGFGGSSSSGGSFGGFGGGSFGGGGSSGKW